MYVITIEAMRKFVLMKMICSSHSLNQIRTYIHQKNQINSVTNLTDCYTCEQGLKKHNRLLYMLDLLS